MFKPKIVYQVLVPGIMLLWNIAWAAQSNHDPLVVDENLTFQEIFASTLQNTPAFREGEVRQEQADAYSAVGKGWLAAVPSLQLGYSEDMFLDNVGRSVANYGIQLPIWRLGEKRKALAQGAHYQEQVLLWEKYLHYFVAGMVRSSLADLAEAEAMLEVEQAVLEDTNALLTITQSLQEAGEVAMLDVLQAQNRLLEQNRNVLNAEAFMVDAEREYEVISGLHAKPGKMHTETLTTQEDIDETHPALQLLASEIQIAEDNIEVSKRIARGNPQLTIGTSRQHDYFTDPIADIVTISLSIPIGGKSIVSAQTSSARRQKVDAEVEYYNSFRNLNRALHEVEHQLFITEEALVLASEMTEIANQQWEMSKTAYELGETTMAQVTLSLQQARQARKELQRLQLRKERLITEFNQLIGEMP